MELATGRASLPLRVGFGAVLGALTVALGGSVVLGAVVWYLGAQMPLAARRYFGELTRRGAARQTASYLSAVTMGYLVAGDLGRAAQEAAADFPAPLGTWLRAAVARVRTRQRSESGVRTFGEELWELGSGTGIRPLMRLGHILRRAEAGSSARETLQALEDLDREVRDDDRLRRERAVAARQGTITVQAGIVLLGLFYVLLSVSGDERLLTSTTVGLVLTALAAVFAVAAYTVTALSARRMAPGEVRR